MDSSIHLLQANIGMGLDHQSSFARGFASMGAFFLASNPDFFRKNAEVESYIRYIQKENPDILYLSEVCGREQKDILVEGLEKIGYRTHVIEGFELWNMDQESHRYLYHIMGTRGNFTHRTTFQQYTTNPYIRFMKRKNGLGNGSPNKNDQVRAILDGGGSQYTIGDTEIGLLHAHAIDTTHVLEGLTKGLMQSKGVSQVLVGDMNLEASSSEAIIKANNRDLERVLTGNTYPYYFSKSSQGIFTQAVSAMMRNKSLSHPDQIFINSGIQMIGQRTLGPNKTGLKSDHTMNHFVYRTTSQSLG